MPAPCVIEPSVLRWTVTRAVSSTTTERRTYSASVQWVVARYVSLIQDVAEWLTRIASTIGRDNEEAQRWLAQGQWLASALTMSWDLSLATHLLLDLSLDLQQAELLRAAAAEVQEQTWGPALLRSLLASVETARAMPSEIALLDCYVIPWGSEIPLVASPEPLTLVSIERVSVAPAPRVQFTPEQAAQIQSTLDQILRR